jgi:signal transduction histidine kinase
LVTDTGKGISIENQRLLFRKFQQASNSLLTRDSTKGTGLGLYISKLIVELSGGKISLESSELGKGSTFVFGLPRF